MTAFEDLDAYAAVAAIRRGELLPVELAEWTLGRIKDLDPLINAFTVTFPERLLEQARRIERRVKSGEAAGPVVGVPIGIKDHIWMKGELATNGSLALRDFVPGEDCVPVARVRESGALIVGKTNNPEFCYRAYTDNRLWGLTRNPWNLERTPGGSSGGSAAAVAAGMVPLAMGTDGGGSIRIPASFCGIVGLKPTFGLVPKEPGFKGWKTLSVDGPLARSVRDVALLLSVMAGPHNSDDMSYPGPDVDYVAATVEERDLRNLKVAYSVDLGFAPVEHDVRDAFDQAVKRFSETGCQLVEDHPGAPDPTELWTFIAVCDCFASEGPLLEKFETEMMPSSVEIMKAGADKSAADYINAMHERAAYARVWRAFFEEYDLLLSPMMQLTAFPVGIESPPFVDGQPIDPFFDYWCSLCYPVNLTNQPAISVPAGFGPDGLPIGLQIIGRRYEDHVVLRAAAAWERIAPWTEQRPPLSSSRDVGGSLSEGG
jgi:Asp-tRNA(Asn)/Glu-tRNA(Gln) amidotransferase A subunit family amidase